MWETDIGPSWTEGLSQCYLLSEVIARGFSSYVDYFPWGGGLLSYQGRFGRGVFPGEGLCPKICCQCGDLPRCITQLSLAYRGPNYVSSSIIIKDSNYRCRCTRCIVTASARICENHKNSRRNENGLDLVTGQECVLGNDGYFLRRYHRRPVRSQKQHDGKRVKVLSDRGLQRALQADHSSMFRHSLLDDSTNV